MATLAVPPAVEAEAEAAEAAAVAVVAVVAVELVESEGMLLWW